MSYRQIVLDTETTGLALEDRIIEVAGVELINRKITGQHFHQYVCPQRQIDQEAVRIHGITEDFLADKPPFSEIIHSFLNFIQGAQLIIHNAPFDLRFLKYEFELTGLAFKEVETYGSVVDTLVLAKKKHPGQQNSLDALCKRYGIDRSSRQFHGALLDANLLTHVYLAMTGGQTSLLGDFSERVRRHCEEQSDEAIHTSVCGLLRRFAPRNDGEPVFFETLRSSGRTESREDLKVIYASPMELNSHRDRIEKIKAGNGGVCLWLDENY